MRTKESERERGRKRYYAEIEKNSALYYKKLKIRIDRWKSKNPEKRKAHVIVFIEKRAGRLKQLPCIICSSTKSEAHHNDYSKPLEVIWYCKIHHRMADRKEI